MIGVGLPVIEGGRLGPEGEAPEPPGSRRARAAGGAQDSCRHVRLAGAEEGMGPTLCSPGDCGCSYLRGVWRAEGPSPDKPRCESCH